MFISSEQKERDSATAYRKTCFRHHVLHPYISDLLCTYCLTIDPPCLGMTVEVLGTVIGTGIQGQIVGLASAPCIPVGDDFNSTSQGFGPEVNISQPHISLEHTVSHGRLCGRLSFLHDSSFDNSGIKDPCCPCHHFEMCNLLCFSPYLSSEAGLHDCIWCYLCHIHPVCHHPLLWCKGTQRWASLSSYFCIYSLFPLSITECTSSSHFFSPFHILTYAFHREYRCVGLK